MIGILCAGGRASPRLQALGIERVPLLYVGAETLLERACRALLEAGCQRVAVLAPEDLPLPGLPGVERARHDGRLVESLIAWVRAEAAEDELLISTADLPFISAAACQAVAEAGRRSGADLVYPIFSRADTEARFGPAKRTYARLSGTDYTGGNVFFARRTWLLRQDALLAQLFELRKSPAGLARIFGLGFLLLLLLGRLTIEGVERHLGSVVGGKLNAARLPYVELGMDVDKPADLEALGPAVSLRPPGV